MRKLSILSLLIFLFISAGAQSIEELNSILSSTRNPYIKPEALDGIMISVKKYRENPLPDQDSLMLEIYQSVSASYVANNHFKQGYQVFNSYLSYKEDMLSRQKTAALNKVLNSVGERARNDETDQLKLQHQLSELNAENGKLSKKVVSFKRNFSLILIILTVIFAVILAGYGIRSLSLRSRLYHNRSTMKDIHHLALTGRYEEGVRSALQVSIRNLESEIAEIKKGFRL